MSQHSQPPGTNHSEGDDPHPQQPGSDEADRDKETTPAGIAHDLEEMAEETGATTDPETAADTDTSP